MVGIGLKVRGQIMDQDGDWKGTLGALALFGAITLGGVFISFTAVEDFGRARLSSSWRVVEGVVLSADSSGAVRYSWFDGASNHIGERVRFRAAAFRASGKVYAPGETVPVYVSPEDGRVAVLEPGGSAALFSAALGAGALMIFIGLAGLIRLTMMIDGLRPAPRTDYVPAE
jgi:hypothetical protein